jgi:hypothetical protein
MPKTAIAKRTFKIVDLIRNRDSFEYIEVPKFPVEINIEVTTTATLTTPKPAPSAVLDRLEKAARDKLDEYETTINEELIKIEKKIKTLMATPTGDALDQAEKLTQGTTVTVKNALASAQGAAEDAVEVRLRKEAQNDDLLTEARVKTGVKVVSGVISVGANVAKLVATLGADVTSYLSIAKTLFKLGLPATLGLLPNGPKVTVAPPVTVMVLEFADDDVYPTGGTDRTVYEPSAVTDKLNVPSPLVGVCGSPLSMAVLLLKSMNTVAPDWPASPASIAPLPLLSTNTLPTATPPVGGVVPSGTVFENSDVELFGKKSAG